MGCKSICRHCNCPTKCLTDISKQADCRPWGPTDFSLTLHPSDDDWWKKCSHHPIHNVFDNICFGANENKTHFASPGECLHMHQLGVAKRSVEAMKHFLSGIHDCNK